MTNPHDAVRRVIDRLDLTALGYDVTVEVDGPRVTLNLDHPLRGGDCGWTISTDTGIPDWASRLEDLIGSWPDLRVARSASVIRPESTELLALLRRQEIVERSANARSPIATAAAVQGLLRVALAFRERLGLLNDEEVSWLIDAFESDAEQ